MHWRIKWLFTILSCASLLKVRITTNPPLAICETQELSQAFTQLNEGASKMAEFRLCVRKLGVAGFEEGLGWRRGRIPPEVGSPLTSRYLIVQHLVDEELMMHPDVSEHRRRHCPHAGSSDLDS